jgi:hypothetical protein
MIYLFAELLELKKAKYRFRSAAMLVLQSTKNIF